MTRFARAKGSKSSNEKKPEEPTSWAEMKNSMLSKKKTNITEEIKPREEVKIDTPKQTEWAPLGDDLSNSNSLLKQNLKKNNASERADSKSKKDQKSKKKKEKNREMNSENEESKFHKKNKKRKLSESEEVDLEKNNAKVRKKNKKRTIAEVEENSEIAPLLKKKKSKETENTVLEAEEKQETNPKNKEFKDRKKFHKMKKEMKTRYFKKEVEENFNSKKENKKQFPEKFNEQFKGKKKFKNNSFEKGNSGVEELVINGEKIPIVKFQGFYVTLEDAERLKKLRNEMIKEGIPKAKLEAAIKLERRRAEKALSRLKKSLCFHCRGHGHLLSNCPKLTENENTSTGICYKCGSTEHSAAECKVVKGASYQYAECFICKEQGHISRQCPDNPRGLYPQGGGCRECGDVTHLRKDCPKVVAQKSEEVVTVGLRNDRNLECLDEEIVNREKQNVKNKTKKSLTVKF